MNHEDCAEGALEQICDGVGFFIDGICNLCGHGIACHAKHETKVEADD